MITRQSRIVMAHRYLYYCKCDPIISDQEYDRLEAALPENDPVRMSVGSGNPLDYTVDAIDLANEMWEDVQ